MNLRGEVPTTPVYCYVLAGIFFFLPYTLALTINVGFPLKVYELLSPLLLATFVIRPHAISGTVVRRIVTPLLLMLLVAAISFFRVLYVDRFEGATSFRGGELMDGSFRLAYLLLHILIMIVAMQGAKSSSRLLVRAWLLGMATSALYMIYCALSLTIVGDAILLPGLERHQVSNIGPLIVSRSGTFDEGNFGGLYFLLSAVLAYWNRRPLLVALAITALILTKSTAAYFSVLVMVGVYFMIDRRRKWMKLPVMVAAGVALAGLFLYFQYEGKFEDKADASGAVRLNEAMTGIEMFKDHPIVGVGLGQYGFRYHEYLWDKAYYSDQYSERHTASNVYVEILSEIGIMGFAFFMLAWANWMVIMKKSRARGQVLYTSSFGILLTWLAYPTFNITFLWCFTGFALGLTILELRGRDNPAVTPLERAGRASTLLLAR